MVEGGLSYCAAELRRHDPDRFLTALFAPPERREDLFALYAFNLEVAKTREIVSEVLLGQIRLQWWRETIEGIYAGTPRQHQVVEPLAKAIERGRLDRAAFDRLIDARERDLADAPPATLDELIAYAEGTSSSLVALALGILGAHGDVAAAAARSIGMAWALTGLLRAVPFHAQKRRLYLPQDLLDREGIRVGDLFDRGSAEGLPKVVRSVAERAEAELAAARRLRRQLLREAIPALLPAVLADGYLTELRRAGYDPFRLAPQRKRPLRPVRLALAATLGRY